MMLVFKPALKDYSITHFFYTGENFVST